MAVTLTPPDLIQPKGQLDAAYFPEGNMDAYVAGWLEQATAIIDARPDIAHPDAAAAAYVYQRAFSYLATLWNTYATTTTIAGQITRTINKESVAYFLDLSNHWKAVLAIEMPDEPEPVPDGEAKPVYSHVVPIIPVW
jgi:hypothetical protein